VAKAAKGVLYEQKKSFHGNGGVVAVIRIGFGRVLPAYLREQVPLSRAVISSAVFFSVFLTISSYFLRSISSSGICLGV
jgi:hypothetical protein